ncbi:MAG: VOC family protein [Rubrobacteraceae bacterium]|nr:VOC family protein [Rubrobacteraceae bacterium]
MFATGFAEIVLIVDSVERSARFYHEVVGLMPETPIEKDWAWFWAGVPGNAQRLALRKGPLLFEEHSPLPAGQRWGQVHYAFTVPRDSLQPAVDQVRESSVTVHGPMILDWMRATSYYFYDPDGNLLEFWSPDPEDAAAKETD